MNKKTEKYLGIDIGTNSVGYAVTAPDYSLLEYQRAPMWGVLSFETAQTAEKRRMQRTMRRCIDKQQRRIAQLKKYFEAGLQRTIFPNIIGDKNNQRQHKTIHHLIVDLMTSDKEHAAEDVYAACAWFMAHRGHFLYDIPAEQAGKLLDFRGVLRSFESMLMDYYGYLPWPAETSPDTIREILQMTAGVKDKQNAFKERVYAGKGVPAAGEEGGYLPKGVIDLLCGSSKVTPAALFFTESYESKKGFHLTCPEETFAEICSLLDEDHIVFLQKLRELVDCATLTAMLPPADPNSTEPISISKAKIQIYEQHGQDLRWLKKFVRKHIPDQYKQIFRMAGESNYTAFSGHNKDVPNKNNNAKKASKEKFSEYLMSLLKKVDESKLTDAEKKELQAVKVRLDLQKFLPKQKDTDNRIIPHQLYHIELVEILRRASKYLPFLMETDETGLSVMDKIIAIFDFRIPYFVGPLCNPNGKSKNVWCVRKQDGEVFPWNFEDMVDLSASETEFIQRMIGPCTYLPEYQALPKNSLLYTSFVALNIINRLKIDGVQISVQTKQKLYNELLLTTPKTSIKKIQRFFIKNNLMGKTSIVTGLDENATIDMTAHVRFKPLLDAAILSADDAENIIMRATCLSSPKRLHEWLVEKYPQLTEEQATMLSRLSMKNFGNLSKEFLTGIYEYNEAAGKEINIIEALWKTNENLMMLMSHAHSYRETAETMTMRYYGTGKKSLEKRIADMYVSPAVKRAVYRSLDIIDDVIKATGSVPKKIFVRMATGADPDQKGKTTSRKTKLVGLLQKLKSPESKQMQAELLALGDNADTMLQDDRLYLYFMQLGRCMFTGERLKMTELHSTIYSVDHVYPKSIVRDNSIADNLVLVLSVANKNKDTGMVPEQYKTNMKAFWEMLYEANLLSKEKLSRLTRKEPFEYIERLGFINAQLTETRQSTKAIVSLLRAMYPSAEIIPVRAALIAEFRQAFTLTKSRALNNTHSAKDAYISVVVGDVYYQRFDFRWFSPKDPYNIQVEKVMRKPVCANGEQIWDGESDLAKVCNTIARNMVRMTRFSFFRKGGLYDQNPLKAAPGLIPLKQGMPTSKYGGYNSATVSYFVLAEYNSKKKVCRALISVELMSARKFETDPVFAQKYLERKLGALTTDPVSDIHLLLDGAPIKINTVFDVDGLKMVLNGKSGRAVLMTTLTPLFLPQEDAAYIKVLETYCNRKKENKHIKLIETKEAETKNNSTGESEKETGQKKRIIINKGRNLEIYDTLIDKLSKPPFSHLPANQSAVLKTGREMFKTLPLEDQAQVLINVIGLFSSESATYDLSNIGGAKKAGAKTLSYNLHNWKRAYKSARILYMSPSGMFQKATENLLLY